MKPVALIKDDFRNLLEYQRWLDVEFNQLSAKNSDRKSQYGKDFTERMIRLDSNWYGKGVTYEELEAGVKEYVKPELLDEIYNQVQHELNPVVTQRLKARKMKFNSLGFGMFCFDRAAMTMFRNEEFYSPSLKTKLDNSEVKKVAKDYKSKKDNSKVIKRWEQKQDGSNKIRTNTKELFAYFPEVPRDRHAVEFFISCDAPASTKADEMIYGGVSAVIMAELLIKAGIKVKINVVIGSAIESDRQKYVGCLIPIKQYDETLDRNVVALMSSDPRFMRFDGFKGVIAAFDNFNITAPAGLGYAMNARQIEILLEQSGYAQKSQAQHRYYFGGVTSEREAIRDINRTIQDIANHLTK